MFPSPIFLCPVDLKTERCTPLLHSHRGKLPSFSVRSDESGDFVLRGVRPENKSTRTGLLPEGREPSCVREMNNGLESAPDRTHRNTAWRLLFPASLSFQRDQIHT